MRTAAAESGVPELSIVVPTFDERDNVAELVRRLADALEGCRWEVVFVDDDSPDGTADSVRELAAGDPRVRCVQRIGRRGLSSACVEGILATSAPFVAVIDGDLQHDETILRSMLQHLRSGEVDVAIGSRYVSGGGTGAWSQHRVAWSRLATKLGHLVVPADLNDPMSGYFMIRRDAFMRCVRSLSMIGFKILLDLFASSERPLRFVEVPYHFRERLHGESKLDTQAAWNYAMLLLDKLVGHVVPVRFLAFALVGGLGVGVHMAALSLVYLATPTSFATAQAIATAVAMAFNFAVNNAVTYRDRRLRGIGWWKGLASFAIACAIGALANVGIAQYLFEQRQAWVLAALAGIAVGAVWNYAVTAIYTWGGATRRRRAA